MIFSQESGFPSDSFSIGTQIVAATLDVRILSIRFYCQSNVKMHVVDKMAPMLFVCVCLCVWPLFCHVIEHTEHLLSCHSSNRITLGCRCSSVMCKY